ncbi:MAG: YebC/PmpR family DNA-binding transcriptional regulator [bacterium]
MAGHSEWQNRKYRKRKQDKKKAKLFGKYSRKIISAARRGGGDPEKNTELRNIIERAKDDNMPKENIERAIKKGTGDLPGLEYEDHVYEGYGPGGIAVMVEVTTDNKNRSIQELRNIFQDHDGKIGERGCVSYQFDRRGLIKVPVESVDKLELFDRAVEAGAEDVEAGDEYYEVYTSVDDFTDVKSSLSEMDLDIEFAQVTQIPKTTVPVSGDEGDNVLALLDELDDHKDVQEIHSNFEMTEDQFTQSQAGASS